MEILNFYAKILPDDIFKKQEIANESLDKAFSHIANSHIKGSKLSDDSWLKKVEQPSSTRVSSNSYSNYTPLEQLNYTYDVVKSEEFVNDEYDRFGNKKETSDYFAPLVSGYTLIGGERIPIPKQGRNPIVENFLSLDPTERIPKKKEVENMFSPSEGIGGKSSLPVNVDELRARYTTSDRRNDQVLIDPQRVPPGLGRGPSDNSQRGIHPTFRILPKNVDQLRSQNNQKVTYESQFVPGQRGSNSVSTIGKVIKKTADTFMVDRPLEKGRTVISRPKQEGFVDLQPTQRDVNKGQVIGSAFSSGKSKQDRLAIYTEAPKTNEYRTPDNFHVSANQKNTPAVNYFELPSLTLKDTIVTKTTDGIITGSKKDGQSSSFNPNSLPKYTHRQSTQNPENLGATMSAATKRNIAVNYYDQQKTTIRDTTGSTDYFGPNFSTANEQTYVVSKEFEAKNTIRQTTLINNDSIGLNPTLSTKQYRVDDGDVRDTMKETTLRPTIELTGRGSSGIYQGIAISKNNVARETIRETTEIQDPTQQVRADASYKQQVIIHEGFVPVSTIRDTTGINDISRGNLVNKYVKSGIAYNPKDVPKDTIRLTTEKTQYDNILRADGSVKRINDNSKAFIPKETIKETLAINNTAVGSFVSSNNRGTVVHDPNDLPRDTIRMTTLPQEYGVSYGKNIFKNQGKGYETNPTEAKNTIRQTTLKEYVSNPQRGDGKGYYTNPHDAKETQRQLTSVNSTFNEGGAVAQNKKATVFEPQNITSIPDRNDIFTLQEKRNPTDVSLAHIPQVNTTGSVRLRVIQNDDREIMSNTTRNIVCTENYVNQLTSTGTRDESQNNYFIEGTQYSRL